MSDDGPFPTIEACQGGVVVVPASLARFRSIRAIQDGIVIVYPDHLGLAAAHREIAEAMRQRAEREAEREHRINRMYPHG